MKNNATRGYVMLISVITFGVVAAGIAVSATLFSLKSAQTSLAKEKYHQARSISNACAEDALIRLRQDLTLTTFSSTLASGSCTVTILGSGSLNRTINVLTQAGDNTVRVKLIISEVVPKTVIASWQEVVTF